MNFYDLLAELEKIDPEVYDRLDSRRRVFRHLAGAGRKLTAAALPLFVGAVFNKAYGQTPGGLQVSDVLNFALKLEYLEMYFYQQRVLLTGLSTANANSLTQIAGDEANHVSFLRSVISSLGSSPIPDPTAAQFDFSGSRFSGAATGAGPFADYRTNPNTYLALAQTFEDLGVRAYKGAAPVPAVMANKTVLTAALSIHGIEARHASRIRTMRRGGPASANASQSVPSGNLSASPKSWISGLDAGGPAPQYTLPVYGAGNNTGAPVGVSFPAEDNVAQGGLTLSGAALPNASTFPSSAFSEAFDEGLDVTTVSTIARLFTIGTSTFFS